MSAGRECCWSALIFSAATSARRYTGPCAIRNGQALVLCIWEKLTVTGRNVGYGARINDPKSIRPFDPQVRVQNSPRSPTLRHRCGPNGVEYTTFER